MSLAGLLDRTIAGILAAGRWLVLPIVLLLFLQWPLRDILRAYSREANDIGQWLFALYVAMAFTAATRARTHLAADLVARRYRASTRATLTRLGALVGLVPWALLLLIAGRGIVIPSVLSLESFPETYNPGYFLIKLALWVLAILVLAQALLTLARPSEEQA